MKIVLIRHAKSNDDPELNRAKMNVSGQDYRLLSSPEPIATDTAGIIWEGISYEIDERLREISDDETKGAALLRAREFIEDAEKQGLDLIAISCEHFMKILFKELRKRGYSLRRTNLFKIDYLEKAVAAKRSEYCGRCVQNCHLENPGCNIGREAALKERARNNYR